MSFLTRLQFFVYLMSLTEFKLRIIQLPNLGADQWLIARRGTWANGGHKEHGQTVDQTTNRNLAPRNGNEEH